MAEPYAPEPYAPEREILIPGAGFPRPVMAMRNLHKTYGSLPVLNGLSLQIHAGEVYGFLGRNGAGKSTAIRILMGITQPTQGEIELFGEPAQGQFIKARQRIGYVAQEQNFYPWMTAKTLSRFVAPLYPRWSHGRFKQLMTRFDLPHERKVGTFSGGMKARLALSLALATQPELLLLDEPTAGMDPVARREFLDLVHEHALSAGAAIFFSTHLIDDIESVANRIGIIESGRTIYEGGLEPLARSVKTFSAPLGDPSAGEQPVQADFAGGLPYQVLRDRQRGGRRIVTVRYAEPVPNQFSLTTGWCSDPMSLEDAFIAIVTATRA